jgi:hypothetical protein
VLFWRRLVISSFSQDFHFGDIFTSIKQKLFCLIIVFRVMPEHDFPRTFKNFI